jgi:hypothetical protein
VGKADGEYKKEGSWRPRRRETKRRYQEEAR